MENQTKKNNLRKNIFNLSAILLMLGIVFGCVCSSEKDRGRQSDDNPRETPNVSNTASRDDDKKPSKDNGKSEAADKGDFLVDHLALSNQNYQEIDKQLKEKRVLEKAADQLNKALSLPHDITLRTADCDEVNAFYDPKSQSVTMCYELMEHFYKLFKSAGYNEQEAYNKMNDAISFVFLHELGHGLIDAYDISVMGKEEDMADSLSSYICLEELGKDEGVYYAEAAAEAFAIESKGRTPDNQSLADVHSLQEQRFYTILCYLYGSNPGKFRDLVTDGHLPKERAQGCPAEYEKMTKSWGKELKPYRKN